MRKNSIILCLLLSAGIARGQEINFSRVQDMAIWYNQSLKTDKQNSLKLNYRNVQYGGQIAYNSVAALFDMPLMSKEARSKANAAYLSLSAGAASDKSNTGILNNTLGMLGLSYAVPIGRKETYMAAGFQGAYYQSNFNVNGVSNAFGDQYDNYGPIEGAPSSDRLANGWSYGHFNLNAGVSVFSNSRYDKWYVGVSAMQVNQPYSYKVKSDSTRLKTNFGVQGGYRYVTKPDDEVAFTIRIPPDRWVHGVTEARVLIQAPRWTSPWVQVNEQFRAAATRAGENQPSRPSSLHDNRVPGRS